MAGVRAQSRPAAQQRARQSTATVLVTNIVTERRVTMRDFMKVAAFAVLAAGSHSARSEETLAGRWDAQLVRGEQVIPFRLDISGSGPTLKGTLYDGFRPYENTTSASFKDGQLVL